MASRPLETGFINLCNLVTLEEPSVVVTVALLPSGSNGLEDSQETDVFTSFWSPDEGCTCPQCQWYKEQLAETLEALRETSVCPCSEC